MNAKRLTLVLSGSIALLMLIMAGGSYLIAGNLKTKSGELAGSKAEVDKLTAQQKTIAKAKRDINQYSPLAAITKTIVPQDKDQAAAVREITKIASDSKVPLTTITFPSSTLGTVPGGKTTAPAASAASLATPNLSQLTPVPAIPGVYNLQLTIGNNASNTVDYNLFTSFLSRLENNRRTAAVSSISIQPQTTKPNQLVFTLIINIYIKP